MSIVVAEKWGSRRWTAGETPAVELEYLVHGTDSDTAAIQALLASIPAAYAGLPRKTYNLERIGDQDWQATVRYGGLEAEDYGLISVEFEIGSQTTRMTQSYATVGIYPAPGRPAPIFYGAINVTRDGVEGVDVEIPTCEWTETWRFPDGTITPGYNGILYLLTGRVNNNTFRGFATGEVLFRGASGRKTRQDAWEISYRFAASPNATGLTVGEITNISKKGWEYLWVLYEDYEDNTAMKLVKRPVAVYVEQVYPYGNFSLLGIGY